MPLALEKEQKGWGEALDAARAGANPDNTDTKAMRSLGSLPPAMVNV